MIRSKDLERIQLHLAQTKSNLHLFNEVKWSKVTEQYLEKYIQLMDIFFDYIEHDLIKIRIMFTQNIHKPAYQPCDDETSKYFLLYYQFIKHAFGLKYADHDDEVFLRIYFDKLPDTREATERFKGFIFALEKSPDFRTTNIKLREDQITEVSSHDHVILQCLDVILGCIQFRLNDQHLIKPEGQTKRGKRTIAKEKLYKHLLTRIRQIYPRFNIGTTTGIQTMSDRWHHPYRHWLFRPIFVERDDSYQAKR